MKRLTIVGFIVTGVWVLVFISLVIWKCESVSAMDLNELGDFLAGATAPLALLWLVIGYFQHGAELRLNTRALAAQEKELRRQVEATSMLAENAERQAHATEGLVELNRVERERRRLREVEEAQPDLIPAGHGSSRGGQVFDVLNRRGEVTDIKVKYDGPHSLTFSPTDRLETNRKGVFTFREKQHVPVEYPIRYTWSYKDRFGKRWDRQFELSPTSGACDVTGVEGSVTDTCDRI